MIYVSTSNGLFRYSRSSGAVEPVMKSPWRTLGFPGVDRHKASGAILVACRVKLGFAPFRKKPTGIRVYRIDPGSGANELVLEARDIHDGHQMICHENLVLLTDTGRNRVHVYDLAERRLLRIINFGPERIDTNHINALQVRGGELLVGLNNRGWKEAELFTLPLRAVLEGGGVEMEGLAHGSAAVVPGVLHTHDIVQYREQLIGCASHAGQVISLESGTPLLTTEGWVRGLAPAEEGLWVGISPVAKRSQRHKSNLEGKIMLFAHDTFAPLKTITLHGSGQVSDLLLV